MGSKEKEIGEALAKKVALEEISSDYDDIMDNFVNCLVEKGTATSLRMFTFADGCLCVEKVVKLIKLSPKLSCLKLSSVLLCNEGEPIAMDGKFEDVAKALWDNKSVKTLSLVNCALTSDAMFALAEMLLHNETLTTLDISSNRITYKGGSHMARLLKSTATLENLVLHDCNMRPSTMRNIIAALKENPQGPVLSLAYVMLESIWPICAQERTDKVEFICTEKVVMLTGIPNWFNVSYISIDAMHLSEDTIQSVFTYLGQGSSRVKTFELNYAKKSHCMQLAGLLLNNAVIEVLTFTMFSASKRVLQAFAQVLETNTHLRSLSILPSVDYPFVNLGFAEAMSFAIALARNRTLEVFDCLFTFETEMVRLFSEYLAPNYALTQFTFYTENCADLFVRRHPIALRNKALQQQALHFVLEECPQRRWAYGFSLTHDTATLRRKLQEKTGKSAEEVEDLIGQKLWYPRENFFTMTGIVKERVVCNAEPPGVVQIDQLGPYCLMHIASFLKADDVKTYIF